MRRFGNILAAAAILLSTAASADEGFWLVQDENVRFEDIGLVYIYSTIFK